MSQIWSCFNSKRNQIKHLKSMYREHNQSHTVGSYPMSTSSCLKGRLPSVSSRKQMPERFIHAEIISAINREQSIFGIDNILKKCQMKHPNFT